jgi:formylglycine-generating enzyme required for sulfatase activity
MTSSEESKDQPVSSGQPTPPAPELGRELTIGAAAPTDPSVSGRELTLQTPAAPTPPSLSGRELTMQTPADPSVSGRELTLQGPGPADLSGRELTMQSEAPFALSGRELTTSSPVAEPRSTPIPTPLSGRERTIEPGATATPTPATYGGSGGRPPTGAFGRPRTRGGGSSVGFDDAWHLEGRKGPHTGQTWGDFDLGGIIGEGGMGAVYRAKQKSLKRRVAIKVLPSNLAADQRLLSRFKLEAETASRLVSPHIVQVYSIGQHDDLHYYAMEFVDGTDLYDVLKKARDDNKPLTPDEASNYIMQAAKGLAEAGRHGVVHRDIKPPNLMLTRDGMVKIADFGIVKVMGEHHLTLTGQAVGTPAYVSPEQGRGDREVDCRSDLYSLGVVFYELATGVKPFTGTTPNALIYQHCYDEPVLPKNIVSGISDEIQAVILRCLQKKPENRYQSADELVRDLEAIRTGSLLKSAIANYKLGTGADEAKREQMNFFQRHLLPIAAGLLLVVGGGGIGGYYWLTKSGEQKRQAELAELKLKSQAESKIANLRGTLSKALDNVAPLPDGVEAMLDELATYAPDGAKDTDVVKWRAKVDDVRVLQARLAAVDGAKLDLAARQAGKKDLESYLGKVGGDDVSAQRWNKRLGDLDAEEARLRAAGASFDSIQLKKADRERFAPILASLGGLVPAEDPQLAKWNARVANFDGELGKLRARIAPLDQKTAITERERVVFANALADLKGYIDENDAEFRRWNEKLEGARGRVATLRDQITAVVGPAPDLISKPKHDQIADKLAAYREAMGDEDPFTKDWLAAIAAAEKSVAGCRGRLAEFAKQADGLLPSGVIPPFERDLAQLSTLVHAGDAEVLKADQLLRDSKRTLDELRAELRVLEPSDPRPVTQAAQSDLAAKLTRLAGKGGIEPERADVYRQRLAIEARRIAALRESLAAFDKAEPITGAMRSGLAQLTSDVGVEDKDVKRWQAKLVRVDDLCQRIGAIDRKEPVPEDLDRMFAALEQLVGSNDAQLVAWRGKVLRINEARAALAVLDRRAPFDAAVVEPGLATLAELVGSGDRALLRWRAKATEVKALKAELARLDALLAQSPEAQAASHARFRRLAQLIGSEDRGVQAAARRQQELDGPPRPSWAVDGGRDAFGLWAAAELPGGRMRFRYVPPSQARVGSPDDEVGRDADELSVELTLPRGFWIAEVEAPQSIYAATIGRDPSRFPGRDPAVQPVERISWDEAAAFCAALNARIPGLGARLPLEAEWELAARAGGDQPWSLPGAAVDSKAPAEPVTQPVVEPAPQPVAEPEPVKAQVDVPAEATPPRGPSTNFSLLSDAERKRHTGIRTNVVVSTGEAKPAAQSAPPAADPAAPAGNEARPITDSATKPSVAGSSEGLMERVEKIAWTKVNAGRQPRPSRARLPNAIGLYDMAGNLAEWVADTYGPWPTATVAIEAPASGGDQRVLRGGSWGDDWLKTRAANRIPVRPDLRSAFAGVRVALDVDWGGAPPDGAAVMAQAQQSAGTKPREITLGGWRVKLEREQ